MENHLQKRTRALAKLDNSVGNYRYNIYREAYRRIKQAIDNGYYLEAITLIESLISDRLESRVSFILKEDYSFRTLGELIPKIVKYEPNNDLKILVTTELNEWRMQRNKALHQMVKIQEGEIPSWSERSSNLKDIPIAGIIIFRKLNKIMKKDEKTMREIQRHGAV